MIEDNIWWNASDEIAEILTYVEELAPVKRSVSILLNHNYAHVEILVLELKHPDGKDAWLEHIYCTVQKLKSKWNL